MVIDLRRGEVLLPTDRRGIKPKSNVDRTNKPSTKTGHPHTGLADVQNRMGRLEERMARLEGTLDVLRQFLVRNNRGTAA